MVKIHLHCPLTCQETGSCRGRELHQKGLRMQRQGLGGWGRGRGRGGMNTTTNPNSESPLQLTLFWPKHVAPMCRQQAGRNSPILDPLLPTLSFVALACYKTLFVSIAPTSPGLHQICTERTGSWGGGGGMQVIDSFWKSEPSVDRQKVSRFTEINKASPLPVCRER